MTEKGYQAMKDAHARAEAHLDEAYRAALARQYDTALTAITRATEALQDAEDAL